MIRQETFLRVNQGGLLLAYDLDFSRENKNFNQIIKREQPTRIVDRLHILTLYTSTLNSYHEGITKLRHISRGFRGRIAEAGPGTEHQIHRPLITTTSLQQPISTRGGYPPYIAFP